MNDLKCTVCGQDAVGVAASPLGPVSFAYCSVCLQDGAEPLHMLFTALDMAGGPENIADWVKEFKSYNNGYIEWNEICKLYVRGRKENETVGESQSET